MRTTEYAGEIEKKATLNELIDSWRNAPFLMGDNSEKRNIENQISENIAISTDIAGLIQLQQILFFDESINEEADTRMVELIETKNIDESVELLQSRNIIDLISKSHIEKHINALIKTIVNPDELIELLDKFCLRSLEKDILKQIATVAKTITDKTELIKLTEKAAWSDAEKIFKARISEISPN